MAKWLVGALKSAQYPVVFPGDVFDYGEFTRSGRAGVPNVAEGTGASDSSDGGPSEATGPKGAGSDTGVGAGTAQGGTSGGKGGDSTILSRMLGRALSGTGAGLVYGGAAAAIAAVVADVLEARRQRRKQARRDSGKVDDDAIVFRVRKSAEEACGTKGCRPDPGYRLEVVPEKKDREVRYGHDGNGDGEGDGIPGRDVEGKFFGMGKSGQDNGGDSSKPSPISWEALTNIPGESVELASTAAALPFGYALVTALHNRLEKKRLERQIEAAKNSYLDAVTKAGECGSKKFDSMFGGVPIEKSADWKQLFVPQYDARKDELGSVGRAVEKGVKFVDDVTATAENTKELSETAVDAIKPSSAANAVRNVAEFAHDTTVSTLAAFLLTVMGSAYLAKKYLHKKFDRKEDEADPEAGVPRILFKEGSFEGEITPEQALCTVAVFRDYIRDSDPGIEKDGSVLKEADGPNPDMQAFTRNTLQKMFDTWAGEYLGNTRSPSGNEALYRLAKGYIRSNPGEWFGLLADQRNKKTIDAIINKEMLGRRGVSGFFLNLPVIGDLLKNLVRWYYTGTAVGRRALVDRFARESGWNDDKEREALLAKGYGSDFINGVTSPATSSGARGAAGGTPKPVTPAESAAPAAPANPANLVNPTAAAVATAAPAAPAVPAAADKADAGSDDDKLPHVALNYN